MQDTNHVARLLAESFTAKWTLVVVAAAAMTESTQATLPGGTAKRVLARQHDCAFFVAGAPATIAVHMAPKHGDM